MNIEASINAFMEGSGKNKGKQPDERYASFDYCYNYFYSYYRNNNLKDMAKPENMQESCLQLGFYLASWGMLRGSSFLLEKSVRHFRKLIEAISEMEPLLWEIDVDLYSEENIQKLLRSKEEIRDALGREYGASDTLITKIMLGVFANVPAFDQYFCKSIGTYTFNRKALLKVKRFYEDNQRVFNSYNIYTFDFRTGSETEIIYTKAKLIDMCGFMEGITQ